jgi:hypothetical protein
MKLFMHEVRQQQFVVAVIAISDGEHLLSLYRVGDPDITGAASGHSDSWFMHLRGVTSGTSMLKAPPESGRMNSVTWWATDRWHEASH